MEHHFVREEERLATIIKLPHASIGAKEALIQECRHRSEAAFAPETLRNYHQIKRSFQDWCVENGHTPNPPVEPRAVSEYVDCHNPS